MSSSDENRVELVDGRLLRVMVGGALLLALFHVLNLLGGKPFYAITRLVDLGAEKSIPAWYSSLSLAIGGMLVVQCLREAPGGIRRHWPLLGVVLLMFGMSFDEVASLHEWIGGELTARLGARPEGVAAHTGWVWTLGPVVLLIFIAALVSVRRVFASAPRAFHRMALGLGLIFVGGVVLETSINFLNHGSLQWLWDLENVVEETFETVGALTVASSLQMLRDAWRASAAEARKPRERSIDRGGPRTNVRSFVPRPRGVAIGA